MPICYIKSGSNMTPNQNLTAAQCYAGNGNYYYVLSASEWDSIVSVDPVVAGGFWSFGLTTVITVWLISMKVGLLLNAVKRF